MRLSILLTVLVVVFLSIFNDATLARITKNNVTSSITHHHRHHHHPTNTTVLPSKHTNHHLHHHFHTVTRTSRDFRHSVTTTTSRTSSTTTTSSSSSTTTRRPRISSSSTTTRKSRTRKPSTRTRKPKPRTTRPTTKSTSSSRSSPRSTPIALHHSTATPTWGLVTPTPDTGSGSNNDSNSDATPTTDTSPDDGGSVGGGVLDPNGSVTATPTPTSSTQDSLGGPTQSIIPGVSNGKFGLAVGLSVGGVAAIGLVGYAFHRRRETGKDESEGGPDMPQVQTRWRHQSFMARVGSVVAWLPADGRSSRSSQKSKRSRGSGTSPPVSPAVDSHSPIPSAGVSQYNLSTAYGHDQMEEIRLR